MTHYHPKDFEHLDKVEKKKYSIIYADPPWQFSNKKTGGSMKSGAAHQYLTTGIEGLKAMDVNSITEDNAVLFMWYVGAMPQEAIDLVHAWGFTIKNMNGFVWNKLTQNNKPHFGMGFYTRAGSESVIIATKGKRGRALGSKSDPEDTLLCTWDWESHIAERGRGKGGEVTTRKVIAFNKWCYCVGIQNKETMAIGKAKFNGTLNQVFDMIEDFEKYDGIVFDNAKEKIIAALEDRFKCKITIDPEVTDDLVLADLLSNHFKL